MNQFSERYKKLDIIDLLRILENQQDYQPLAIEAAKAELHSRKTTDEELVAAKAELENEETLKVKSKERNAEIKSTIINSVFSANQDDQNSSNKNIIRISVALALFSIYILYDKIPLLKSFINDEYFKLDLEFLIYFLPIIILPVSTFLFWSRHKFGWTLLIIYFTFTCINTFAAFVYIQFFTTSFNPNIDLILAPLLAFAFIWAMARKNILLEFGIEQKQMNRTLIITAAVTILLVLYWII